MKKILIITLFLSIFILGACSSAVVISNADQSRPLKIWMENSNGNYKTLTVVDEATGVNYVVVSYQSEYGALDASIGITVRLNADGTPYTSK